MCTCLGREGTWRFWGGGRWLVWLEQRGLGECERRWGQARPGHTGPHGPQQGVQIDSECSEKEALKPTSDIIKIVKR